MSWSYSGNPSASDLDAVRFEIGDTDIDEQLIQDEEILYALEQEGSVMSAAARCCEILWRSFARQADRVIGPLKIYYSQRTEAFEKLSKHFRAQAIGMRAPILYQSGNEDEDIHDPIFTVGMLSNDDGS